MALMIAMMMPTGNIINATKRRYIKVKPTASNDLLSKLSPSLKSFLKPPYVVIKYLAITTQINTYQTNC